MSDSQNFQMLSKNRPLTHKATYGGDGIWTLAEFGAIFTSWKSLFLMTKDFEIIKSDEENKLWNKNKIKKPGKGFNLSIVQEWDILTKTDNLR